MGILENIDALLVKFGITQETLARIAGVASSSVNGRRNGAVPRGNAIERMCES
ncbi:XRE family transcriptional regulator [Collinsella sp. AM09-41]|nr:XRE family transcriptional regulator [Collinsella sp. AM09-41]